MSDIRTRFAPSPTGFMHVGAARTALFAWLVAKQNNGNFILRIEDTDKVREVSGAEDHIIKSLKWLGVNWDEGPDVSGKFGPYRQSERLDIYKNWAIKLLSKGDAYADPYTQKEIDGFRQKDISDKKPFLYRNYRPENPPKWTEGKPIRLKSRPKTYGWHDEVLGDLTSGPEVIDDFIIIKSDGYPTYNFCHIIDDYLMQISHVIRSQEFISSVPKFLNLYEILDIKPPIMATLPFVMAMEGGKKLGKRDGAKDILDYSRDGYLPKAMMNFLATLGWNDGTEKELFTEQELISKFSLDRVHKSPARFDMKRLIWMNGSWIRDLSTAELFDRAENFLPETAANYDKKYKLLVLEAIQERIKYFAEVPELSSFFFEEPTPNLELIESNKILKKIPKKDLANLLTITANSLAKINFSRDDLAKCLNDLLISTEQKPSVLFGIVRLATTWAKASPELSETLFILGKEKTCERIHKSIEFLS